MLPMLTNNVVKADSCREKQYTYSENNKIHAITIPKNITYIDLA